MENFIDFEKKLLPCLTNHCDTLLQYYLPQDLSRSHSVDHNSDKTRGAGADLKESLLASMGASGQLDKDGAGIANYVPSQRLEWKRYKQYTRNDIMAAIDEVINQSINQPEKIANSTHHFR